MLIVGAKGFAKEILQVFHDKNELDKLAFYDDITEDIGKLLFNKFSILNNKEEVKYFFGSIGNDFTLGIGNSNLRYNLYRQFVEWGGNFKSVISDKANVGKYNTQIEKGVIILNGVNISNDVKIGLGTMIYYNSNITHDCTLGEFVEVSPAVNILGNSSIGSYTHLGANSTILPGINVGKNVTICAGAVVTKDIPDNSIAIGAPAKVIKKSSFSLSESIV